MVQYSLDQLLSGNLYALLLIFMRIGGAMMFLAGLGESFIPARVRLGLSMLISLLLLPILGSQLPEPSAQLGIVFHQLATELVIGFTIGLVSRLMLAALASAGTFIAFQVNLSNVFTHDVTMAAQGSVIANFLSLVGLVAIFATDLHHGALRSLADSYNLFPPLITPAAGDLADMMGKLVSYSFLVALQLSIPFVMLGVLMQLSFGLINRLVPSLQVFFLATPAVVASGFALMAIALPGMLAWFLQSYDNSFSFILVR